MTHTYPHMELEEKFGEWTGWSNMVACSSGTAALHLALEALQLPENSRILVPEFTMVACARAVVMAGHTPVFVDCNDRLLLDVDKLQDIEMRHVNAIMPVHVYGRRCDMDAIIEFAASQRSKVRVIEDLAEAHGVPPHTSSDAACWSFYKNKIIKGQEGGAVAFQRAERAEYAKRLRSLGFSETQDYLHCARGMNSRLSDVHAELILQSLKYVNENVEDRRQIEAWYDYRIPPEWKMPAREAVWVYDIRIPGMTPMRQDRLVRKLKEAGVQARHGFKPMSQQPEFFNQDYAGLNANRMAQEVIYLPVHPMLTEEDVDRYVSTLRKLVDWF